MRTLSAEFDFEVGDEVMHRSVPILHPQLGVHGRPVKHIVQERHIQECHGGIQTFCRIRGVSLDGGMATSLVDIPQSELRAYPTEAEFAAYEQAKTQADEARYEEQRAARELAKARAKSETAQAPVDECAGTPPTSRRSRDTT